jgi:hypothetical protein
MDKRQFPALLELMRQYHHQYQNEMNDAEDAEFQSVLDTMIEFSKDD